MVANLAEVQVFTTFANDIGPEIEQAAAQEARSYATTLVNSLEPYSQEYKSATDASD